jgi:endonuclease YncB( thermonuclease family)
MKKIFEPFVHSVVRVIDGDTQVLMLDLGFSTFKEVTTRILGLDCPEKSTLAGRMVKTVVQQWLEIATKAEFNLTWVSSEVDMYGRTLGDFRNNTTALSLSVYMLHFGLAKPFHEKRVPWTAADLDQVVENCRLMGIPG